MNPASDLVNKLWRLCAVLRKDGITYQQYVTELTFRLFLKMTAEQKREEGRIPEGMRWHDPRRRRGRPAISAVSHDIDPARRPGKAARPHSAGDLRQCRDVHSRAGESRQAGDGD